MTGLSQRGLLFARSAWLGIGALIAVMSLAAMPPQAGFVSEWYLFQTFFQAFHVASLAGRLALVLGGAGLALTAAIAFAMSMKLFGLGLQGSNAPALPSPFPVVTRQSCSCSGRWCSRLRSVCRSGSLNMAEAGLPKRRRRACHAGRLAARAALSSFAFISPSKLIIVMPLLALLPVTALLLSLKRLPCAASPYGTAACRQDPLQSATTQLTFSNALRTFYGFVYRPRARTERDFADGGTERKYFLRRLSFSHDVAPIFGPYLFQPVERAVLAMAGAARRLQSGSLNLYIGIIGVILIILLATIMF